MNEEKLSFQCLHLELKENMIVTAKHKETFSLNIHTAFRNVIASSIGQEKFDSCELIHFEWVPIYQTTQSSRNSL